MSPRKLQWLLRARGTDLSAWPARERAAALLLLRASDTARQAFAEALAIDPAEAEADATVAGRMQAALRRSLAPATPWRRSLRAGALAACMAAGVYLATTVAPESEAAGSDLFSTAQSVSFAALDQ